MSRRYNQLILLILILISLSLFWGCSQPENVLSDISNTRLSLTTERLPTLPSGMVYELWVSDASGNEISLGKFAYDNTNRTYLDPNDSTKRDNVFWLEDDLLKLYWDKDEEEYRHWFTTVFVSVETFPVDSNGAESGPIMLHDAVTDPDDNQIELRFQNKDVNTLIGDAIVRFNMESVSDGNRSFSSVGQGLWFSTYRQALMYFPDTTNINVLMIPDTIDAIIEVLRNDAGDSIGYKIVNYNEIFDSGPVAIDTTYIERVMVTFGADTIYLDADTLWHKRFVVKLDSAANVLDSLPYIVWTPVYNTYVVDTTVYVNLDIFAQDEFALPDYGADWNYKGWIVSSTAKTTNTYTLLKDFIDARFTPPAWKYNSATNQRLPGDDGALISTGSFSVIDGPDNGNPFIIPNSPVPPYPGEDFLNTTKLDSAYGMAEIFDFLPAGTNYGSVFISLEPSNFKGNKTNFPLIPFGKNLPAMKSGYVTGQNVQINMWNWTQTIETDQIGFPQITVEVEGF